MYSFAINPGKYTEHLVGVFIELIKISGIGKKILLLYKITKKGTKLLPWI